MKRISINSICNFINFEKKNSETYKYNKFSNLFFEDKTILKIKFLDYYENNKNKYDTIEVDSIEYKIEGKTIEIPINHLYQNNCFIKKITYKNKSNNNKVNFLLELYKGKIHNYKSYLNVTNGGYSYEFFYEAKFSNLLPSTHTIFVDNNVEEKINEPENFGNKYRERFCIINIPKQIKYSSNKKNESKVSITKKEDKIKSKKIFILIKKNESTFFRFKIKENTIEKKEFQMEDDYKNLLTKFYDKYKDNTSEFYKNVKNIKNNFRILFEEEESPFFADSILNSNNENESSEINEDSINSNDDSASNLLNKETNKNIKTDKIRKQETNSIELLKKNNYRKYFELAFKNYRFKNTEEEYKMIEQLGFLFCLKYFNYDHEFRKLYFIVMNYFDIVNDIKEFEYIDRINAIIGFINDKIFETEKREILIDYKLIDLGNKPKKDYEYCYDAYMIFFKILDKLNEESAFFRILNQLNGLIYYDNVTNQTMYSGSLFSVNDIRFELLLYVKKYFYVTSFKSDCYAHYSPYTKMIFYHPLTFADSLILDDGIRKKKKLTLAILFLIMHEVCGHYKTNINNFENTPEQFFSDTYDIILKKFGNVTDSGNIFEYLMVSEIVDIPEILKSLKLDQLLSEEIYIDKDFSALNNILKESDSNEFKQTEKEKKKKIYNDPYSCTIPQIMKTFDLLKKDNSEEQFRELIEKNNDYKIMMKRLEEKYGKNYKP